MNVPFIVLHQVQDRVVGQGELALQRLYFVSSCWETHCCQSNLMIIVKTKFSSSMLARLDLPSENIFRLEIGRKLHHPTLYWSQHTVLQGNSANSKRFRTIGTESNGVWLFTISLSTGKYPAVIGNTLQEKSSQMRPAPTLDVGITF